MATVGPAKKKEIKPEFIMETAMGFQKSRILLTAFELGLFSELGDARKTVGQVARALRTDERATDRLMSALCSEGLLEKRRGRYSNTPSTAKFLVNGRPDYMAGLMHVAHLWESWSALTAAVRKGGTAPAAPMAGRGKKWLTAFIAAMHWLGSARARHVIELIDLGGVSRVLDLGGGSGIYSAAVVRAGREVTATVFDLPQVVSMTRKYVAEEGLSAKVKAVAGDFHTDDLGKGYDLVLLSAIVHSNSPKENMRLLRKVWSALNPGGQVVIQEFIVDENRVDPPFAAMFALNMLVNTQAGDTYTETEVAAWLRGAGFGRIRRTETRVGTTLITGRKRE